MKHRPTSKTVQVMARLTPYQTSILDAALRIFINKQPLGSETLTRSEFIRQILMSGCNTILKDEHEILNQFSKKGTI